VAFFKVPINGTIPGLRGQEKLTDDAHEPVLPISKKQNRELSYASERGASRTCQDKTGKWMNPGKRTKIMFHYKFSKVDCLWFCELCHLTVGGMCSCRLLSSGMVFCQIHG
jgi:hypothetical protein